MAELSLLYSKISCQVKALSRMLPVLTRKEVEVKRHTDYNTIHTVDISVAMYTCYSGLNDVT